MGAAAHDGPGACPTRPDRAAGRGGIKQHCHRRGTRRRQAHGRQVARALRPAADGRVAGRAQARGAAAGGRRAGPGAGGPAARAPGRRAGGLLDGPRPGAPRRVGDERVLELVDRTLAARPEGATHWGLRTMAKASGLPVTTVGRVWRAFGLQPHRAETFKLSTDPLFAEKVRDIVGLYLAPPERALALARK